MKAFEIEYQVGKLSDLNHCVKRLGVLYSLWWKVSPSTLQSDIETEYGSESQVTLEYINRVIAIVIEQLSVIADSMIPEEIICEPVPVATSIVTMSKENYDKREAYVRSLEDTLCAIDEGLRGGKSYLSLPAETHSVVTAVQACRTNPRQEIPF